MKTGSMKSSMSQCSTLSHDLPHGYRPPIPRYALILVSPHTSVFSCILTSMFSIFPTVLPYFVVLPYFDLPHTPISRSIWSSPIVGKLFKLIQCPLFLWLRLHLSGPVPKFVLEILFGEFWASSSRLDSKEWSCCLSCVIFSISNKIVGKMEE